MDQNQTTTVYDMRHALSTGIDKVEVILIPHGGAVSVNRPHLVLKAREWVETKAIARKLFEEMKLKKIKQLREQLEAVSKMQFYIIGEEP